MAIWPGLLFKFPFRFCYGHEIGEPQNQRRLPSLCAHGKAEMVLKRRIFFSDISRNAFHQFLKKVMGHVYEKVLIQPLNHSQEKSTKSLCKVKDQSTESTAVHDFS